MGSASEYQVRCSRCGHPHDEPIEWLMAHSDVECPAEGCGAKIQVHIGDLTAPARISGEPGEVFDLSKWKSEKEILTFTVGKVLHAVRHLCSDIRRPQADRETSGLSV